MMESQKSQFAWSVPPKNGISCFFTEESFERYNKQPSLEERLIHTLEEFQKVTRYKSDRLNKEPRQTEVHNDERTTEEQTESAVKDEQKGEWFNKKYSTERKYEPNLRKSQGFNDARLCKAAILPPRKSSLTKEEHKIYLDLYLKYANMKRAPKESEFREYENFKRLKDIVTIEQQEFMIYLERLSKANRGDYTYMPQPVSKYVEEWLSYRQKEVEHYQKYYNTLDSFPLHVPGQINLQMIYNQPLLELGNVPKMVIPELLSGNRPVIPTNYEAISKKYPPTKHKDIDSWNHEPCNHDTNAESLANQHKAHIVMSSGSLACLIDNHAPEYSREWELPVIIKEHEYIDGDRKMLHKVVYIERPFISNKSNIRKKNNKFYRNAFKTYVSRPGQVGHIFSVPKKTNVVKPESNESPRSKVSISKRTSEGVLPTPVVSGEDMFDMSTSVDNLETFGTTTSASKSARLDVSVRHTSHQDESGRSNIMSKTIVEGPVNDIITKEETGFSCMMAKEGSGVNHKSIKEGSDFSHTMKKEGLDVNHTSIKEGSDVNHTMMKEGSHVSHAMKKEGPDVNHTSIKEGSNASHTSNKEGSDVSHIMMKEGSDNSCIRRSSRILEKKGGSDKKLQVDSDDDCSPAKIRKQSVQPRNRIDSSSSCDSESERLLIACDSQEDTNDREVKSMETEEYIEEPPASPDMEEEPPASPDIEEEPPASPDMEVMDGLENLGPGSPDTVTDEQAKQETAEFFTPGGRKCILIPLHNDKEENVMDHTTLFSTPPLLPKSNIKTSPCLHKGNINTPPLLPKGNIKKSQLESNRENDIHVKPGIVEYEVIKNRSQSEDSDTDKDDRLIIDQPVRTTRQSVRKHTEHSNQCQITTSKRRKGSDVSDSNSETFVSTRLRSKSNEQNVEVTDINTSGSKVRYRTRSAGSLTCSTENEKQEINSCKKETVDVIAEKVSIDDVHCTATVTERQNICESNQCVIPTERSNDAVEVSHKRGRGRPRKNPKSLIQQESIDSSKSSSVELSESKPMNLQKSIPLDQAENHQKSTPLGQEETVEQSENIAEIFPSSSKSKKSNTDPTPAGKTIQAQKELSNSNTLDAILQMQEKMLHTETTKVRAPTCTRIIPEPSMSYKCPDKNNVTYNLWTLGGYRFIIRCGYHGIYKNRRQQLQYVHIDPKLEYQAAYGREQLTTSETACSYFSAYIRPNTTIVRARINPLKSELISVEELKIEQIIPRTVEPMYNPVEGFEIVHNIFQRLYQLPVGQYLLSHEGKSPNCQIKKATENNKRGSYDLHFQYLGFMSLTSTTAPQIPWLPIDTHTILSLHKKQNRVPATFEPKDFHGRRKRKRRKQNQRQNPTEK